MGILDEAIRDHLDLKRQRGANREELSRLEDEAFGPPSRPGEPDFPQAEPAEPEAGRTADEVEPPTTVVGAEEPPVVPEPAPEVEPARNGGAEPAAEEHPVLSEEAASPATPFDHSFEDELDLSDLDLELEESADTAVSPAAPPAAEPAAEPPADEPPTGEPPIESLETVEHPFEPGLSEDEPESDELTLDEPESEEAAAEPSSDEPPPQDPAAADEAEPESSEDDVLADTPDFLRDAPEDDELWFEQGEPKDFDFD